MRTRPTAILLAGSLVLLFSTQAIAKKHTKKAKRIAGVTTVTGLAAMHSIRRAGNRLCMSDHYHFGDGASRKSKAGALSAARRDWVSFVNAEYGPAWAHYALAGSKGGKCSYQNGQYNCSISARPCRR